MSTTTSPSKKPPMGMPAPSAEHRATDEVARRLVELVGAGKHDQAMKELYADTIRHVEGTVPYHEGMHSITSPIATSRSSTPRGAPGSSRASRP